MILVDENDVELGTMEKMEAHRQGLLHRAFSVFVFNEDGDLILHRRADHKYHSGGLWTNTCCSHPRQGESALEAGHRRLGEEMGFDCPLKPLLTFIYRSELDNDLVEHELDHVLVGTFSGEPNINPEEVAEWKAMSMDAIRAEIDQTPECYTEWFKIVFERVYEFQAQQA